MGIERNNNFDILANKPIDSREGPFDSVASANAAISSSFRYQGLTVKIIVSGSAVDYWYEDGITDGDLVEKSGGGGVTDHGDLSGLSDDDHAQYVITQSGSGSPDGSVTPTRINAIYRDTDNGDLYYAVGNTSSDWIQFNGGGGGSASSYQFIFERNLTQNYADFVTILAGTAFTEVAEGVTVAGYQTSEDNGDTWDDRADIAAVNAASAGMTPGVRFHLRAGVSAFTGEIGTIILTEQ